MPHPPSLRDSTPGRLRLSYRLLNVLIEHILSSRLKEESDDEKIPPVSNSRLKSTTPIRVHQHAASTPSPSTTRGRTATRSVANDNASSGPPENFGDYLPPRAKRSASGAIVSNPSASSTVGSGSRTTSYTGVSSRSRSRTSTRSQSVTGIRSRPASRASTRSASWSTSQHSSRTTSRSSTRSATSTDSSQSSSPGRPALAVSNGQ